MKKNILHILFLFVWCMQASGQIPNPKIGDLIVNPDGSRGIVFWINPEETMGYMLQIKQYEKTVWSYDSDPVPGLPLLGFANWSDWLSDTSGYMNTLILRHYYDCSVYPDIAACKVDIDNGWFLPSAGIGNYLYMAYPDIRRKFIEYGGDTTFEGSIGEVAVEQVWTSTQLADISAVTITHFGLLLSTGKDDLYYVFPIKQFSISEYPYDTTLTYRWNTGDSVTNFVAKPTADSLFSVTATSSVGCAATAEKQIFVVFCCFVRLGNQRGF